MVAVGGKMHSGDGKVPGVAEENEVGGRKGDSPIFDRGTRRILPASSQRT